MILPRPEMERTVTLTTHCTHDEATDFLTAPVDAARMRELREDVNRKLNNGHNFTSAQDVLEWVALELED